MPETRLGEEGGLGGGRTGTRAASGPSNAGTGQGCSLQGTGGRDVSESLRLSHTGQGKPRGRV